MYNYSCNNNGCFQSQLNKPQYEKWCNKQIISGNYNNITNISPCNDIYIGILNPNDPLAIPPVTITPDNNLIPPLGVSPSAFPGVTIITNWQTLQSSPNITYIETTGIFVANKAGNYVFSTFIQVTVLEDPPGNDDRTVIMQMYKTSAATGIIERIALAGQTESDSVGTRNTFAANADLCVGDSVFVTISNDFIAGPIPNTTTIGRITIKLIQ